MQFNKRQYIITAATGGGDLLAKAFHIKTLYYNCNTCNKTPCHNTMAPSAKLHFHPALFSSFIIQCLSFKKGKGVLRKLPVRCTGGLPFGRWATGTDHMSAFRKY
jgi:hypothetical protein